MGFATTVTSKFATHAVSQEYKADFARQANSRALATAKFNSEMVARHQVARVEANHNYQLLHELNLGNKINVYA